MVINLHNKDCMEALKEFKDNQFDLAIVDPPYGLGNSVVNSGGRFKRYENKNFTNTLFKQTKFSFS